MIEVRDKTFLNEVVSLEGNYFRGCNFKNCTFIPGDGSASYAAELCYFSGSQPPLPAGCQVVLEVDLVKAGIRPNPVLADEPQLVDRNRDFSGYW